STRPCGLNLDDGVPLAGRVQLVGRRRARGTAIHTSPGRSTSIRWGPHNQPVVAYRMVAGLPHATRVAVNSYKTGRRYARRSCIRALMRCTGFRPHVVDVSESDHTNE